MKKALNIFLLLLCPLLIFSRGFTLKGHIDGLPTGTVSLAYQSASGEDTTIYAHINDGRFSMSGVVPEPELVRLTLTDGWSYNTSFFLENAEIAISMVKDADEKTAISGSPTNAIYEKLKPGLNDFFVHARESKTMREQASTSKDPYAVRAIDSLWRITQGEWIQNIRTTITTDPYNYAALYFIQWLLFKPDNMDAIHAAFMQLSPSVRQGAAGQKFQKEFAHLYKTSPGNIAPEITGKDTLDCTITLASMRGKLVLLDFWASYCGPCRVENRHMLADYQKYHADGFEIVSFSLDNERLLWLMAIRADGLIWPQASDLRGGAGATAGVYDITDLPRNVLIDRAGKICAKDLHGAALTNAIETLLAGK